MMSSEINNQELTAHHQSDVVTETGTITFPVSATIGIVDKLVNNYFVKRNVNLPELILDFSQSEYIEIASLVLTLSLTSDRWQRGLATYIKLPENRNTRDFLRQWKFPKAFIDIVGLPFYEGVVEDSKKYFGENPSQQQQKYTGAFYFIDGKWEEILADQYFSFTAFNAPEFGSAFALDEAGRWNRQVIRTVLNKHLAGPQRYFPSRIIFEALMNGVRHPGANKILIASHFASSPKKNGSGHFTVVIWDDGESIIDTLRLALKQGKEIRSLDPSEIDYVEYSLKLERKGEQNTRQLDSGYVPSLDDPDELFLVAATLPGITRDAMGLEHVAHPDLVEDKSKLRQPGMGLYLLINAAVKIFKGSVSFRTKEYFMNIKQQSKTEGEGYKANIIHNSSNYNFAGNLLTIRLPLSAL